MDILQLPLPVSVEHKLAIGCPSTARRGRKAWPAGKAHHAARKNLKEAAKRSSFAVEQQVARVGGRPQVVAGVIQSPSFSNRGQIREVTPPAHHNLRYLERKTATFFSISHL